MIKQSMVHGRHASSSDALALNRIGSGPLGFPKTLGILENLILLGESGMV